MGSVGAITGRHGAVYIQLPLTTQTWYWTEIARITSWTINQKPISVTKWADSDTGGFVWNAPGPREATITTVGKFQIGILSQWNMFRGGDYAALRLFVDNRDPFEDGISVEEALRRADRYEINPALCTEYNLTMNIDTEEVVGWTAEWVSCGEFSMTGTGYWKDFAQSAPGVPLSPTLA